MECEGKGIWQHLSPVTHDLREATCEEDDVKQGLEGVAEQICYGKAKLLDVLCDALVRVRQPCPHRR